MLICDSQHLVDGGGSSLAQSFDAAIEMVEAILGEMLTEILYPDVDEAFAFEVELASFVVFEEAQAHLGRVYCFFRR